jgi:hypothetical protein
MRVAISQCGERLPHGMKGALHSLRADWSPTGSHGACSVAMGKNLKERDGVVDVGQVGVAVQLLAEFCP